MIKNIPDNVPNRFNAMAGNTLSDIIFPFASGNKETLDSLQATYTALVDNRISRIIKVLTIFSATLLPLSLITGIWGMNHAVIPLRDGINDFWIVLGGMATVAGGMLAVFKFSKWL